MGVNVNFKRGTQSSLNTLINGSGSRFTEGTFYLTSDTNRLYFAQSATNLVDLNQYIHIWTGAALPTTATLSTLEDGDIYYWKGQNILAIYNATSSSWVQLNPDTTLYSNNQNITLTDGTNAVTLDIEVSDQNAYGMPTHTSQGQFSLQGGSNVSISRSGNTITIASTDTNDNATYTLSTTASSGSAGGILQLNGTGTGATSTSIAVKGSGSVSVSSDSAGNITVSGSGGVSAIEYETDSTGSITTTLTTSDGPVSTTAALTPIIAYGDTGSTTAVFVGGTGVYNPTATLSVYTKAEVDQKIADSEAAANAMTYAGPVSSSDASTKIVSTANVGTTYKVSDSFSISSLPVSAPNGQTTAKPGDLIIAKGSDGNVTWDLIPSGDDQRISGTISGNSITVSDQYADIIGIEINGSTGNYGTINVTSATAGTMNTLTVAHGAAGTGVSVTASSVTASTTQQFNSVFDVPIVTAISKDSAGHVTNVTLGTYRFKDTHQTINDFTVGVGSSTTSSATITYSIDGSEQQPSADLIISSNNLEITSTTGNNVNIDLVWGSF